MFILYGHGYRPSLFPGLLFWRDDSLCQQWSLVPVLRWDNNRGIHIPILLLHKICFNLTETKAPRQWTIMKSGGNLIFHEQRTKSVTASLRNRSLVVFLSNKSSLLGTCNLKPEAWLRGPRTDLRAGTHPECSWFRQAQSLRLTANRSLQTHRLTSHLRDHFVILMQVWKMN